MGLKKNVNVITRNGRNPENKVYILRQWLFFVIFYGGKCCLLLLLFFPRTCLSKASSSRNSTLSCNYYLHFSVNLGDQFANDRKKTRESNH